MVVLEVERLRLELEGSIYSSALETSAYSSVLSGPFAARIMQESLVYRSQSSFRTRKVPLESARGVAAALGITSQSAAIEPQSDAFVPQPAAEQPAAEQPIFKVMTGGGEFTELTGTESLAAYLANVVQ